MQVLTGKLAESLEPLSQSVGEACSLAFGRCFPRLLALQSAARQLQGLELLQPLRACLVQRAFDSRHVMSSTVPSQELAFMKLIASCKETVRSSLVVGER